MCVKYKIAIVVLLLIVSRLSYSQENPSSWQCASLKSKLGNLKLAAKTTVADPAEDNYDVKYLKFNLKLNNLSTSIIGDVTTVAQVVAPSLSAYVFELKSPLVIDSVLINGVNLLVSTSGYIQTVALGTPLPLNSMFTVQVFYHGTPPSGTTFGATGITNTSSPSWGNKVTYTLSESYKAKEWWPCKQSLTDKIDSVDMWITVPDTLMAGSNGVLQAITPVDATHNRYEWKERNPIDHYLISAAVAAYVDYSYYMHYTGSTDSTLVQNYIYNNPATLPFFKSVLDSTGRMIDYFSTLYGRYPFWQEKYGHCMAPLSGGMEHQTMTTCGFFNGTLVAHELGHQWFGDNVTCGTWADICMNEGFAAYTEYLYIDHFWSHTQATNDITDRHKNVRTMPGGSVYVDDTTNEARIFDSRLSYDKGACMLHMLRFIVSDDTAFFRLYRLYQSLYAGGTGTIMDFKNAAVGFLGATVNGISLDTFFNQWAYQQGFPIYDVSWNQSGSDVYVQLNQSTSMPSSVPLFTMPMEIKLISAAGDTVVRVINDQALQVFHFTWGNEMNFIGIDPNSWLVDSINSVTHDVTLKAGALSTTTVKIHPNPATHNWIAGSLQPNSSMVLADVTGRVLWQGNSGNNTQLTIPADNLEPGVYLLRISNEGKLIQNSKLVKK